MKVSALTVNGSGPSTGWLYASTFESDLDETVVPNPPSTLRAKAEDDSITIAWNPPSSKNILVRGYTIGWGKGIPDEYTKVVDNKQRYFVIEDLSKCLLIPCPPFCYATQLNDPPSPPHLTLGLVSQLAAPLSQLFLPTDLLQLRQPTNPPFVENKFAHESSQICFTTSPSQPIVQLSKTLHCLSAKRRDKCQRYPKCKSISTNLLFSFSLQVSFQSSSIQTSFSSSDLCFHCRAEQ